MVRSALLATLIERLRPHETKLRFLVAGGLNTVFGVAIFPLLMWTLGPLGWNYIEVLILCQFVSICFAYSTNKMLVFKTKGNYLPEFMRFSSFYLVNFLVNIIALPFLVEVLHFSPIFAQTMFVIIVVCTSYIWHSRVTFRA